MRILTPWTSQPQGPVEIDWSNPITRGLIYADYPGAAKNLSVTGVGKYGRESTFRGQVSSDPRLSSASFSFYLLFKTEASLGSQGCVIGRGSTSNDYNNKGFGFSPTHSAPAYSGAFYCGDSYTIIGKPTGAALSADTNYSIAGTCDGAYGRAYNNGILSAGPVSVSSIDTTANLVINKSSGVNPSADDSQNKIYFVGYWNRALSDTEVRSISQNPWQIFRPLQRRIFVPVGVSGDATGTGSLYAITLSSPEGTASGTGASNGTGEGSLASSSLTSPTASASGSALATASIAALSTSAPSATATGSALATGALTTVTLTTITASANGSALATGTIDQIDLSTVAGNATGTTAGNADGVGSVATIALSAPAASAIGSALATGSFAAISLGTVSGSASAATDGQAAASIQPISISAPLAIAIASSVATGGIQSIGLTAPTGTASGQAQTIARPTSDISNTGWTPSTGSDLYAMLDEVSPDDADYISTSSVGAVCKFGMNATAFPGSASQQLSLRASSSTGNGLSVTIKDGATTIASRTLTLTPTFDLHTITLTSGEIAAITSGNLTVEMTST